MKIIAVLVILGVCFMLFTKCETNTKTVIKEVECQTCKLDSLR